MLQGPANCTHCKNYKDGPNCVSQCPSFKYPDDNKVCQPCYENCKQEVGCTGPNANLGYRGCKECSGLVLVLDTHTRGFQDTKCVNGTVEQCEDGFWSFSGKISIPNEPTKPAALPRVVRTL